MDSKSLMLCCIFLQFLYIPCVNAVMADPNPIEVKTPDGKVLLMQRHGDEFFHYTKDNSGYLVAQKKDGFYYYAGYHADGRLWVSDDKIGTDSRLKISELPDQVFQQANLRRREHNEKMRAAGLGLRSADETSSRSMHKSVYKKTLVLLVAFTDQSFTYTREDYEGLLNGKDYKENGATGSVRDYYMANSMGTFEPEFVVFGPYTVSGSMSNYGGNNDYGNDRNPSLMIREAVELAYEDGVNLSDFDSDNDGCVDNIFVYYAGHNEAEGADENTIWPHSSSIYNCEIGGVRLGSYACSSELKGSAGSVICGIGTCCHEYGHTLGLSDLYDTDAAESGGNSSAVGNLSLMCSGNYNNGTKTPPYLNAEERFELGWLTFDSFEQDGTYSIPSIDENKAYKVETGNDGEYYLFENRQQKGWDTYVSGHGMVIYHVDKSNNVVAPNVLASGLWESNSINTYPQHQCFDLVEADGNKSTSRGAYYPGSKGKYTSFSYQTTPAAKAWSSLPIGIALSDITENDEVISFTYRTENEYVYLGGMVTDRSNNPIVGAMLYLTPIAVNSEKTLGLLRMATVLNAESYIATCNSSGQYLFEENIPAGTYQLIGRFNNYVDNIQTIELKNGVNTCNLVLYSERDQYFSQNLSWHGNLYSSIGTSGEDFKTAVRWLPEDLVGCDRLKVGSVNITVGTGNPTLDVYLTSGVDTLAHKQIRYAPSRSVVSVDFMEDNVVVDAQKELMAICAFSNCLSTDYPMGLDNETSVKGKSSLIEDEHGWVDLTTSSDGKLDGNMMIDVDLYEAYDFVDIDSFYMDQKNTIIKAGDVGYLLAVVTPSNATYRKVVWTTSDSSVVSVNDQGKIKALSEGRAVVTATCDQGKRQESCEVVVVASIEYSIVQQFSQHRLYLDWSNGGSDRWQLSWKISTDSIYCDTTLLQSDFLLDSLAPSSILDLKIKAYQGENLLDEYSFRSQTQSAHSYPMAICLMSGTFKAGSLLLLDVSNIPEGASPELVWKWDNQVIDGGRLLLLEEGDHLLRVEIGIENQGVEVIQRKITVTAE